MLRLVADSRTDGLVRPGGETAEEKEHAAVSSEGLKVDNTVPLTDALRQLVRLQDVMFNEEREAYKQQVTRDDGQSAPALKVLYASGVYQKSLCSLMELSTLPLAHVLRAHYATLLTKREQLRARNAELRARLTDAQKMRVEMALMAGFEKGSGGSAEGHGFGGTGRSSDLSQGGSLGDGAAAGQVAHEDGVDLLGVRSSSTSASTAVARGASVGLDDDEEFSLVSTSGQAAVASSERLSMSGLSRRMSEGMESSSSRRRRALDAAARGNRVDLVGEGMMQGTLKLTTDLARGEWFVECTPYFPRTQLVSIAVGNGRDELVLTAKATADMVTGQASQAMPDLLGFDPLSPDTASAEPKFAVSASGTVSIAIRISDQEVYSDWVEVVMDAVAPVPAQAASDDTGGAMDLGR